MLRRTRFLLPLAMAAAALAGAVAGRWLPLALVAAGVLGFAVDVAFSRVAEGRVQEAADQVVAFAADVQRPAALSPEGGREWKRLVTALNEVARVLRERFEALRGERERFERVLDAIPASVLLFSEGTLAYGNPEARDTFDLPAADVDALAPRDLTPLRALSTPALADAVAEVAETGRPVTVQVTRDGRELAATASPVTGDEVALIATDITDLRRIEHLRRDFVANASHELKTPVTGMQALADSLDMALDRDPARARGMVARIQSEATRLAQLVRDLLDLARLEEDASNEAMQRVDVGALAAAQVERLRGTAEDEGVAVTLEVEEGASVVGLPEDLKLIIGNLILNAVQYNTVGGRVAVTVRRHTGVVGIDVADDGIGIPTADQDRIFERFYRVDKARSRAAGGTGLGLSLVRNAVQRHGGNVRVSSVLGEGSRFTVELPVDGGRGS